MNFLTDDFHNISNELLDELVYEPKIHIRYKQRNGKKCKTIIEGLVFPLKDMLKILSRMKKTFSCGGDCQTSDDNHIIILQGDKRENAKNYLVSVLKINKDNIYIHGI